MTAWLFLAGAIVLEVGGTLALRVATSGRRAWYALVALAYLAAFTCLAVTLSHGLGIGMAYGIWSATGVALTAVAARVLFDEPLTRTMLLGIALIVAGVLLIELGAEH